MDSKVDEVLQSKLKVVVLRLVQDSVLSSRSYMFLIEYHYTVIKIWRAKYINQSSPICSEPSGPSPTAGYQGSE